MLVFVITVSNCGDSDSDGMVETFSIRINGLSEEIGIGNRVYVGFAWQYNGDLYYTGYNLESGAVDSHGTVSVTYEFDKLTVDILNRFGFVRERTPVTICFRKDEAILFGIRSTESYLLNTDVLNLNFPADFTKKT
ncbi:hypothetical protein PilKf_00667 [Pillotina sp. SPG140]